MSYLDSRRILWRYAWSRRNVRRAVAHCNQSHPHFCIYRGRIYTEMKAGVFNSLLLGGHNLFYFFNFEMKNGLICTLCILQLVLLQISLFFNSTWCKIAYKSFFYDLTDGLSLRWECCAHLQHLEELLLGVLLLLSLGQGGGLRLDLLTRVVLLPSEDNDVSKSKIST